MAVLAAHLRGNPRVGVAGPVLLDQDGEVRLDSYKGPPSLWSACNAFFPLGGALIGTRFHPEASLLRDAARGGPVPRVCGSAIAIRREAFDEAGPMDERYFLYFEEVEWQERVAGRGWGIELVPEARIVHAIQGARCARRGRSLRGQRLLLPARAWLRPGRIARVMLTGFAMSRLVLRGAMLVPRLRAKARRMDAGYAALATRVRELRAAA